MSKKITDNEFIYYFQENCTENLALQIDYSFKEIGFISIFKSAYIKHKGKIATDKLLKVCPIFDPKDATEFHDFICKFCVIKRGFFVQERFDKVVDEILRKSEKSKEAILSRWNKNKGSKADTNEHTNVSTNDYTKDKVKDKVKDKDIIINNNIEKDKKDFEEIYKAFSPEKNFKVIPYEKNKSRFEKCVKQLGGVKELKAQINDYQAYLALATWRKQKAFNAWINDPVDFANDWIAELETERNKSNNQSKYGVNF